MGWRSHHPLDGVNSLCIAVGSFAAEAGTGATRDEDCLPLMSPLGPMMNRRRWRKLDKFSDKYKHFRRTMPQDYRAKCAVVWQFLIRKMELRPLRRGELEVGLKVLREQTGLPFWTLSRILSASRDAGLLELLHRGKRGKNGKRGQVAIRRVSRDFIDALSKTLKNKLFKDACYVAATPSKIKLTAPPPPQPALQIPKAVERPPPERSGVLGVFSQVGDVAKEILRGFGKND